MSIEKLAGLVAPEMQRVNERILEHCRNHVELIPTISEHLVSAGGKRIRPMFTVAAAKLCGYEGARHINLAAAVEFMHTATLLHDDVVDDSHKRRGRDTANAIWGNKSSVLVGDYLLGKAFQMMVADGSLNVLRILSDAAAKIAEGEVLQLELTNNINTTREQYIEVVRAKTAELFAAACEVGPALFDDAEKQEVLRSFGDNFGIAFQIIDDALDYSANPEKFGKTVGDDFREGKVTLPVILAYEAASPQDKEFWQRIISAEDEEREKELSAARDRIQASGAFGGAVAIAREYGNEALDALKIFPEGEIKDSLTGIVEFCIDREF